METYKEYPETVIPEFLKDWEDTSWHNDALASSERTEKTAAGNTLVIWVNCDEIENREPGMEEFKFYVELRGTETGDEIETIPANDEETAIKAIEKLALR